MAAMLSEQAQRPIIKTKKEICHSFGCVPYSSFALLLLTLFSKYEVEVSKSNNESARVIFYGELIYILECKLGGQHIWKTFRNQTRLLAVIKPCLTKNRDATKTLVEYEDYTTPIVTDLQVIQCVVGRVPRGSKWAIIDRSGDQVRTEFIDHDASGFYASDHDDMYTSS